MACRLARIPDGLREITTGAGTQPVPGHRAHPSRIRRRLCLQCPGDIAMGHPPRGVRQPCEDRVEDEVLGELVASECLRNLQDQVRLHRFVERLENDSFVATTRVGRLAEVDVELLADHRRDFEDMPRPGLDRGEALLDEFADPGREHGGFGGDRGTVQMPKDLEHEERVPVGARGQHLDHWCHDRLGRDALTLTMDERADVGLRETGQSRRMQPAIAIERMHSTAQRVLCRPGGAQRGYDEQATRPWPAHQMLDECDCRVVRPVKVIDDEDNRSHHRQPFEQLGHGIEEQMASDIGRIGTLQVPVLGRLARPEGETLCELG